MRHFHWNQINEALMANGFPPKRILALLRRLGPSSNNTYGWDELNVTLMNEVSSKRIAVIFRQLCVAGR